MREKLNLKREWPLLKLRIFIIGKIFKRKGK
jgi:hypothetical protein